MRIKLTLGFGLALCLASFASADTLPKMRWDGHAGASTWTKSALAAVAKYDSKLAGRVPSDIKTYCPGYKSASKSERRAFWVAVLSGLAKYESGFNPKAGSRYLGLTQISPKTASAYGCKSNAAALKDGSTNLACAVKIIARQVGRDGVVAGNGKRGVGRDWGPMSRASVRADIAAWTKKQAYCKL